MVGDIVTYHFFHTSFKGISERGLEIMFADKARLVLPIERSGLSTVMLYRPHGGMIALRSIDGQLRRSEDASEAIELVDKRNAIDAYCDAAIEYARTLRKTLPNWLELAPKRREAAAAGENTPEPAYANHAAFCGYMRLCERYRAQLSFERQDTPPMGTEIPR